jgi:bifunctional non-homologous end joining protein LigD
LIAKRPDSVYESGRRSGAWVKVKPTQEQEFVMGGYTLPEGGRKYFGALLVGYYQANRLLFAGRVGTGFSERALAELYGRLQKNQT